MAAAYFGPGGLAAVDRDKRSASRNIQHEGAAVAKSVNRTRKRFFTDEQQAVTVAVAIHRVFCGTYASFCELVVVWRGRNGLHVCNERPYRITRGDLFCIRAEKTNTLYFR